MENKWEDGVPTVGERCEMRESLYCSFEKVKILVVTSQCVIVQEESCLVGCNQSAHRIENVEFRPIKTQEDKRREEAISDMTGIFNEAAGDFQYGGFEAVYNAGYRKQGELVSFLDFREEWLGYKGDLQGLMGKFNITRKL